ncbi:MAG: hypothetical protein BAJATHORv1_10617 [Candidatus Thorarchaeota archaeon]|nr:MAG: hypothetical protein BAJATHORv1_10617 [Candidatus Thorarchaeota archaeon]
MIVFLVLLVIFFTSIAILNAFYQGIKKPDLTPKDYLKRDTRGDRTTIVFAGDSITHGRIGVNYINFLPESLDEKKFDFINAGINGQLAWNLLQRIDEIIACHPDIITVLIGTNDANGALTPKNRRSTEKRMNLPQEPEHAFFKSSLSEFVAQLKRETAAKIALISIPTIGESLDTPELKQSRSYSITIKEIAEKYDVDYLPLHEKMEAYLLENPSQPKYDYDKSYLEIAKGIFKRYFLRKSWDSIAQDSGFQLHVDYLHLNSRGAKIVSSLIGDYIARNSE